MAQTLSEQAIEQSTFVITVSFADENGDAVTPNNATWTLTDERGVVVNERTAQVISPLASSVEVLLSGDDLAILAGREVEIRLLTVEALYDSSLGDDLPLKEEIQFSVRNLTAVA